MRFEKLVPILEDNEFQFYCSNDLRFKNMIKIKLESKDKFEELVKSGGLTLEMWEKKIIQKEAS